MKFREIENSSSVSVDLQHKNGAETSLPPGAKLKDVDIINSEAIKGQVKTTNDLTEVQSSQGKQIIHG